MTPVVLVTRDATLDDLSATDYADIWAELRQVGSDKPRSYDKCIELLGSGPSKARWQQFEKGEAGLSREMRNALRTHVGLPQLPRTVAEAVAQASPDASVWTVGEGIPEHVIMVSSEPVTLHINGSVQAVTQVANVTPVTRLAIARKRYIRPCVPVEYAKRLQRLHGVSWQDVIEAGLKEFEV